MNSDVSIDSSSEDEGMPKKRKKNYLKKRASKGWSTCSNGFDEIQDNKIEWIMPKCESPNLNESKTMPKKKRRVHKYYNGLENIQVCLCSVANEKNISPLDNDYNSLPIVCANSSIHSFKSKSSCKILELKHWALNDLSNSFLTSPVKNALSDSPMKIESSSPENSTSSLNDELKDICIISPLSSQEEQKIVVQNFKTILKSVEAYTSSNYNLRGSDWLKGVELPDNEKINDERKSISKSSKFINGGFALQALKLLKKEQSNRLIWSYRKNDTIKNPEKCLIVKFILVVNSLNFSIIQCLILEKAAGKALNKQKCYLLIKQTFMTELKCGINSVVRIFPPWQSLNVPTFQDPIILCNHVDVLENSNDDALEDKIVEKIILPKEQKLPKSSDIRNLLNGGAILKSKKWNMKAIDLLSGKAFSLIARVQRIWECKYSNSKLKDQNLSNVRYCLLVQDINNQFFKVSLQNLKNANNSWKKLLSNGLGNIYTFTVVKNIHKLLSSRHKALFAVLKDFYAKQQQENTICTFCYLLSIDCSKSEALDSNDLSSFPPFVPYSVSSLNQLQEEEQRFSCYAKILAFHNNTFYISHKVLQKNKSCPYVKLKVWVFGNTSFIHSGCNVFIKEAVIKKEFLFIDEYSSVAELDHANSTAVSELSTFSSKDNSCWKHFLITSDIGDVVILKGIISNVDAYQAFSWLECDLCGMNDLYDDPKLQIFCNVCQKFVKHPKLNMTMTVEISIVEMLSSKITVELTCSTTKKLLEIPNDVFEPKCDVTDVLHKKLGPTVCAVQNKICSNEKIEFYLKEIIVS